MNTKHLDLTGQRFGRLTVAGLHHGDGKGAYYWTCKCDCGGECVALTNNLRKGNTISCGCFRLEQLRGAIKKHGEGGTRLYRIWKAIHTRCYNSKFPGYKYYGGRGITVCDEWKSSFIPFKEWAEANGYSDNLTIDRIDVNKEYSPDNCRWATMKEQNKNKRAPNGFKIKEI